MIGMAKETLRSPKTDTASNVVLSDVVAYVVCCTAHGSLDDKKILTRKLESLGASVKARFGKGVTHVVFRRNASASLEQRQMDDDDLRGLYAKAEKATQTGGTFALFVDPFWIEACAIMQRKAAEDKYLISCPPSPLFDLARALTPGSSARKKRKRVTQQPKPAGAYELDMTALDFSSTQQMMDNDIPQGAGGDSTYPGSADAAEKKVKWSQDVGRPGTAPSTVRSQATLEQSCMTKASIGSEDMHEAARILLILPAGVARSAGHATPSGRFVTPKPVTKGLPGPPGSAKPQQEPPGTCASPQTEPSSSGRRATARPRASSARTGRRATPQSAAGTAKRRRSANAGQPPGDEDSDGEGVDVSEAAARPQSAPVRASAPPGLRPTRMRPPSPSPSRSPRSSPEPVTTTCGGRKKRTKAASSEMAPSPQPLMRDDEQNQQDMLLGGAAVRDDQLRDGQAEDADNSHIEVVPISTGVSIPVQQAPHGWQPPHPYNPKVESVEQQPLHKTEAEEKKSKEQLRDKDPPTSPISTDTCDGDVGSGARCAVALPADPKSQHKGKSGAAAQPLALEQEPSTAADTPISVPEEPAHDQQLQPSCNVRRSCQNSTSVSTPAQACSKENARGSANLQQVVSPVTAHRKAEAGDRSRRPRQGFLSLTAVEEGTAELAAAAVKQLRRLRACPEGHDEMITHLIVGSQKRTLKVMLAVARGAWLLSPAWLTASLEAGRWQDEQDFQAEVAYSAAAAAARLHFELRKPPLLKGVSIHIAEPDAHTPQTASRAAALKRTALAHGAQVTGLKLCTLCVVMHGSSRAKYLCRAVTEDWLLTLAESFAQPPFEPPYTLTS